MRQLSDFAEAGGSREVGVGNVMGESLVADGAAGSGSW